VCGGGAHRHTTGRGAGDGKLRGVRGHVSSHQKTPPRARASRPLESSLTLVLWTNDEESSSMLICSSSGTGSAALVAGVPGSRRKALPVSAQAQPPPWRRILKLTRRPVETPRARPRVPRSHRRSSGLRALTHSHRHTTRYPPPPQCHSPESESGSTSEHAAVRQRLTWRRVRDLERAKGGDLNFGPTGRDRGFRPSARRGSCPWTSGCNISARRLR